MKSHPQATHLINSRTLQAGAINRFAAILKRSTILFSIATALALVSIRTARAASIVLTSGTTGTFQPSQSFNETRAADVTVLTGLPLSVSSMRLDGLDIRSATSALVGARIYNSTTSLLLASADITIFSAGSVLIPISALLAPGDSYRVAFYVETSPLFQARATMFDPDPERSGGVPYIESQGFLRINSFYSISTDTYPTNSNFYLPQITVNATVVPEPTIALMLTSAFILFSIRRRRNEPK